MTKHGKHVSIAVVVAFLVVGSAVALMRYLMSPSSASLTSQGKLSSHSSKNRRHRRTFTSGQRKFPSIVQPIVKSSVGEGLPACNFARTNDQVVSHINKVLAYIYSNMHPETHLAYSLPGDKRLTFWSVVYDDAMRAMVHIETDDIENARRTIDYFIDNSAVQKVGWIRKGGELIERNGWVVNIVDASETRRGGRGIEHVAHTGPNAYLGIAAVHLFVATGDKHYLNFARSRWDLIKDLQNENAGDFNYGGVRMGPLGDPDNPQDQHMDFKRDNPSYYVLYNGEHALGFKALSDLLSKVDPDEDRRLGYRHASRLIQTWDQKIYDKSAHLFYIGTTEERFWEPNIGEWVNPGVISLRPLDTSALSICAYGVKGLDVFEPGAAEKIRKALDDNFKVTVKSILGNRIHDVTGYDFVSHADRKKLVLYVEEGPWGDSKIRRGVGREPFVTDEWSSWVAMADLRLAKDWINQNETSKALKYWESYRSNAFEEGMNSADPVGSRMLAYPYAHPISSSFNKPVGFGWNTHHAPYSIIGGVARIMSLMGFDPFSLDKTQFAYKKPEQKFVYAKLDVPRPMETLGTEAEMYINQAWGYVVMARKSGPEEIVNWRRASAVIERMFSEHPDWVELASKQNTMARNSIDQFPLSGMAPLSVSDIEPIYRKYWALYHVGTGEFIRVLAYSKIAELAKNKNDKRRQWDAEAKAKDAAQAIVRKYYFAQAFDDSNGWMWQPANAMAEYLSLPILRSVEGYPFFGDHLQRKTGTPAPSSPRNVADSSSFSREPTKN